MNRLAVILLALSLGVPAFAYAQEHHEEAPKSQASKPAKQARPSKAPKASANHSKPSPSKPQHQQKAQHQKAGGENVKAGNGGRRIPDEKYSAHFGEQHAFRVSEGDFRNHRFNYGGYGFGFVGAWPEGWLYTQDVYVCMVDDVYYLCNAAYPGVTVELVVE
jgi:hypothetical protein